MRLQDLYEAIDAKPFHAFMIELVSGRLVKVRHPENIFILPNRQTVHHIMVYDSVKDALAALIYPEGVVAILFNGKKGRR